MSPLCKLETTLSGGLWGEGGSADERRELSRLEERTAQEAVRPLMLRARPYKRVVGHPVGLYDPFWRTRLRKATLGACLAPVRPVCYTTPLIKFGPLGGARLEP